MHAYTVIVYTTNIQHNQGGFACSSHGYQPLVTNPTKNPPRTLDSDGSEGSEGSASDESPRRRNWLNWTRKVGR